MCNIFLKDTSKDLFSIISVPSLACLSLSLTAEQLS